MEGNRHNFAAFLHGAIGVLGVILGGFGVMGYLRFGEELNQMLNTNIPASSWVSVAVNICAILGVLLTFPLQIYPVIEMCEIFLFSEGNAFICYRVIVWHCVCIIILFKVIIFISLESLVLWCLFGLMEMIYAIYFSYKK